jgi:hypothetical protein
LQAVLAVGYYGAQTITIGTGKTREVISPGPLAVRGLVKYEESLRYDGIEVEFIVFMLNIIITNLITKVGGAKAITDVTPDVHRLPLKPFVWEVGP